MTLSDNIFDNNLPTTSRQDVSTNLDSLYCSHLWSNSCLRNAIITAPNNQGQMIKYCYTCKGKIRKYELTPQNIFLPNNHSTPNRTSCDTDIEETAINELQENSLNDSCEAIRSYNSYARDLETLDTNDKQCIPSISHQVESSFRHKYFSYETQHEQSNQQRRLRKTLKGMGCIVNFKLTESPVKKRTQIQACSISVMIIAIVVISFILVNFTNPNFIHATNASNTFVVPTVKNINQSSSAITNVYTELPPATELDTTEIVTSTEIITTLSTENSSENLSSSLSKVRKNIRTYPRLKNHSNPKPKDIINRDILAQRFCSCQKNEICMLDESSGTSVCRIPIDNDDPTGCGGLCALETEACQLVDKARGVRVCRLLTMASCLPHEWRCQNALCVASSARCDGVIQCYDRSDEMHCDCDLTKQFRCGHSISCFPNTKLCDGAIDCWDGYDEFNCTAECPREQFTCTDGQCILSSRFCDGLADCADGSDEPGGCDGECSAHEIRCRNHRCVARAALCDGQDHCGDATDELHCPEMMQ